MYNIEDFLTKEKQNINKFCEIEGESKLQTGDGDGWKRIFYGNFYSIFLSTPNKVDQLNNILIN